MSKRTHVEAIESDFSISQLGPYSKLCSRAERIPPHWSFATMERRTRTNGTWMKKDWRSSMCEFDTASSVLPKKITDQFFRNSVADICFGIYFLLFHRPNRFSTEWSRLAYQSIGVIYGDIGTSPLYVYSSTFTSEPSRADLLGALSLIIWTLTLIVTIKYVCIVLLADDQGQGGTFAVYSLLSRYVRKSRGGPLHLLLLRLVICRQTLLDVILGRSWLLRWRGPRV